VSKPPPSEPPDSFSPPGARPMTALWATGWAIGITYLFVFIAVVLASLRRGSEADLVSGLACQAIAYLIGLFVILRVHAPDAGIRDFIGVRSTHWAFYPLSVLIGGALVVPANELEEAIERWSGHKLEDNLTDIFHAATPFRQALMALVVILLGPMLEEILFRGALFRPLLKVHPAPVVVGLSAALFAISHPAYHVFLPLALPIGLVGLALGVVRQASGSLAPGVALHATFNAVSFYAMAARWDPVIPRWLIAATSVATFALLALAQLLGRKSVEALLSREYDRQ
jgi:membrane protease YdiL (CAAX protease family)